MCSAMGQTRPTVSLPVGASAPKCNAWFLGFTQLIIRNAILIGSGIFAELTAQLSYGPPLPQKAPVHGGSGPIKYMVRWANPTQQPKRHLHQFIYFCPAHCRMSSGMFFSLKIAPSNEGSGPQLTHASLGPPESKLQTASRLIQPILHS